MVEKPREVEGGTYSYSKINGTEIMLECFSKGSEQWGRFAFASRRGNDSIILNFGIEQAQYFRFISIKNQGISKDILLESGMPKVIIDFALERKLRIECEDSALLGFIPESMLVSKTSSTGSENPGPLLRHAHD